MPLNTGVNQAYLNHMLALYNEAEVKMLQKVAQKAQKGIKTHGWSEQKLKDTVELRNNIQSIMGNVTKVAKSNISQGIIDSYKKGVRTASNDLGIPLEILNDTVPYHVQRMVLETQNLIDNTQFPVLRNTEDVYREVIGRTSTGVLLGTDTPLQAAQQALDTFAAKGITGFTDKAGRNWDLASYVDMATRTSTAHAALQGHLDRQVDLDSNLIRVSSIGSTCPICAPWQGRILSIKNGDPKYPSLDTAKAAGLFHPNCKHTIMAYFEGMDDDQVVDTDNNTDKYEATQEQRYNERQIRKWKRMDAVAITPEAQVKSKQKIGYWQGRQRELINEFDLKRNYAREGIKRRIGDPSKAIPDLVLPDLPIKLARPPKPIVQPKVIEKPPEVIKPVAIEKPNPVKVKKPEPVKNDIKPGKVNFGEKVMSGSREYTTTIQEGFEYRYDQQSQEIVGMLNRRLGITDTPGGKGHYNQQLNNIVVDLRKSSKDERGRNFVFFHELGHFVDHQAGLVSQDPRLINAMRQDLKATQARMTEKYSGVASGNRGFNKELKAMPDAGGSMLSDVIGGLTDLQTRGNWGHDSKYWNRGNKDHEIASEMFAHLFALKSSSKEAKALVKEFFPNAMTQFDDLISETHTKLKNSLQYKNGML